MKELTMDESEALIGGFPPLLVALAAATFMWVDANWTDIKRGAVDGWNDSTR